LVFDGMQNRQPCAVFAFQKMSKSRGSFRVEPKICGVKNPLQAVRGRRGIFRPGADGYLEKPV
jgi:hypothetical protein